MKLKSYVINIFPIFKNLIEKLLGESIITLFTDGEGKYIGLAKFLS